MFFGVAYFGISAVAHDDYLGRNIGIGFGIGRIEPDFDTVFVGFIYGSAAVDESERAFDVSARTDIGGQSRDHVHCQRDGLQGVLFNYQRHSGIGIAVYYHSEVGIIDRGNSPFYYQIQRFIYGISVFVLSVEYARIAAVVSRVVDRAADQVFSYRYGRSPGTVISQIDLDVIFGFSVGYDITQRLRRPVIRNRDIINIPAFHIYRFADNGNIAFDITFQNADRNIVRKGLIISAIQFAIFVHIQTGDVFYVDTPVAHRECSDQIGGIVAVVYHKGSRYVIA